MSAFIQNPFYPTRKLDVKQKVKLFNAFLTTVSNTRIKFNMVFRAIAEFDGSGSKTCIELKPGDVITRVHKIDDVTYIGRNERTGETGAFPAAYVQGEAEDRAIPLAGSKIHFFEFSYFILLINLTYSLIN